MSQYDGKISGKGIEIMATIKTSIRVNARSPKYGYGFHKINSGFRFDLPYVSLTWFDGGKQAKQTIRTKRSGLRLIYENNRNGKTRIAHNVA